MILYMFNTQVSEQTRCASVTYVLNSYEWPSGSTSDRQVPGKYYMLLLGIMIILYLFLPEFIARFLAVGSQNIYCAVSKEEGYRRACIYVL